MQWPTTFTNFFSITIRLVSALVESITGKSWLNENIAVAQPLLTAQDIQQIHAAASSASHNRLLSEHEVKTLLVGERSSVYSGSGYEFADNQRYVTGDDSRFINWRMLARTGKLYRKVFNEERRPQVWIVSDKRASMRFGSKKRLKVTQAVIHALYYLYQSQQQQLACGGIILEETPYWFNPAHNLNMLQPFIDKLAAPTPPLKAEADNQQLDVMLRQLVQRLAAGSIIILISDFHDLKPDMQGTLHTLASRHTIIARHIIDPLEEKLPEQGKYQVAGHPDNNVLMLDCDNDNFRYQYQITMQQQMENIETQLTQAGIHYQRCLSDEDLINQASS